MLIYQRLYKTAINFVRIQPNHFSKMSDSGQI